jgi:ABC-type nitrate/sulfonate/bicarbonate transport system permease component
MINLATKLGTRIIDFWVLIALLLFWEAASRLSLVDPRFIPPPSEVIRTLYGLLILRQELYPGAGALLGHIQISLVRASTGFAGAAAIAIPTGVLLGWYKPLYRFMEPVIEVIRPVPSSAIIPVLILFFGIGEQAKVFVIIYACYFILLINTIYGVQAVDKEIILAMRSMKANDFQLITKALIPASLPHIFAGLRICVSAAFILVVVAEFIFASKGLGWFILEAERTFRSAAMFSGIFLLGVIGFAANKLFLVIEDKAMGWHKEARR